MTSAGKPPWIGKDGGIDLLKIPIDSVLRRSVLEGDKEFRGACSVLRAVYQAGRMEAGIYLYGLFIHNYGNMARKELLVSALSDVPTKESASILFRELNYVESNNTTRGYINSILKSLSRYPKDITYDGFVALLNDRKWSYKMKKKFAEIINHKDFTV